MADSIKNWVHRRKAFEDRVQQAWESLRTELESAAKSFDHYYAFHQGATVEAHPKDWCLHIAYRPRDPGAPDAPKDRSIDVCFDPRERRVFARTGADDEIYSVDIGFNEGGVPCLVDSTGARLSNDRVSQMLLETFFFPGSLPEPHVRFPVQSQQ
jgi:hypothetical protein